MKESEILFLVCWALLAAHGAASVQGEQRKAAPGIPTDCIDVGDSRFVRVDCVADRLSLFSERLCPTRSWLADISPRAAAGFSLPASLHNLDTLCGRGMAGTEKEAQHTDFHTPGRTGIRAARAASACNEYYVSPLVLEVDCINSGFSTWPTGLPIQTIILRITGSTLPQIRAANLSPLQFLVSLDLSNNSITSIEPGAFDGLVSLQSLILSQNNLPGFYHALLKPLQSLVMLKLDGNMLTALPLRSLETLSALQLLWLDHNQLRSLSPTDFASLTSLTELALSHNNLTSLPPSVFANLTSLQHLFLTTTNISSLPPALFASLTQLQILNIFNNEITSMPPTLFRATTALQALDMSNNPIRELDPTIFANLSALEHLDVGFNQLSSVHATLFAGLGNLQTLGLNGTLITDLPDSLFQAQTNLLSLVLSDNKLTSVRAAWFNTTSQLQVLSLQWNQITDIEPSAFDTLANLNSLLLGHNNLTAFSPTLFSRLTNLDFLNISNNRIREIPDGALRMLDITQIDASSNMIARIGPRFFTSEYNSAVSISGALTQATCSPNRPGSTPCPPDLSLLGNDVVEIYLYNNPFESISKTAFDVLPQSVTIMLGTEQYPVNVTMPPPDRCCELSWIYRSPAIAFTNVMCNGAPVSTFGLSSNCACKQQALTANPTACYSLVNTTFALGVCSPTGCPTGYTAFRSGAISTVTCTDARFNGDLFTLFETACQSCFVANCSNCDGGLVSCQKCDSTTFLTNMTLPRCVPRCEDSPGLFSNVTTRQCQACPSSCLTCATDRSANNTFSCLTCAPGFHRFLDSCVVGCPPGDDSSGCQAASADGGPSTTVRLLLIVVFVVVGVVIIVFFLCWCRARHRSSSLEEMLIAKDETISELRKSWEIPFVELQFLEQIGRGTVGQVWRARWREMDVAVKMIAQAHLTEVEMAREMDREASMLKHLRHAYIVQFHGAGTTAAGVPFIVTELMELGSLTQYLTQTQLDWATRLRFAHEIAAGMALVHSLGRMHRDLKSGNILVARANTVVHVKVADFGTATLVDLAKSGGGDERRRGSRGSSISSTLSRIWTRVSARNRASVVRYSVIDEHGPAGSPDAVHVVGPSAATQRRASQSTAVNSDQETQPLNSSTVRGYAAAEREHEDRLCMFDSRDRTESTRSDSSMVMVPSAAAIAAAQMEEMAALHSASSSGGGGSSSSSGLHTRGVGTPMWMAPELLAGEHYGPSADVFSYAIVLWELAAQATPWQAVFSIYAPGEGLLARLQSGERPAVEDEWHAGFVAVMRRCWEGSPAARPSFAVVESELQAMTP